ncbi:ABC-type amino acid transporter [Anopheles sinensis]|uniref:ABC-type amino acid transporter n=1 Tax=Anopheles sinensis TaxID=74873 RepID=A0A084W630_ANOSI|nr:ABC-type amino acid transporter [Anopheles sinensis]
MDGASGSAHIPPEFKFTRIIRIGDIFGAASVSLKTIIIIIITSPFGGGQTPFARDKERSWLKRSETIRVEFEPSEGRKSCFLWCGPLASSCASALCGIKSRMSGGKNASENLFGNTSSRSRSSGISPVPRLFPVRTVVSRSPGDTGTLCAPRNEREI